MLVPRRPCAALAAAALIALTLCPGATAQQVDLAQRRLRDAATDAYVFAYPMVLMEVTRRVSTNVLAPAGMRAPMNQFAHLRGFPDHAFRDVVRPNVDTLYSVLWFDVSREPLVLTIPDGIERYYMLPMLDMWTDVFAVPSTRTLGARGGKFAIVGPRFSGALPDGVEAIRAPTAVGWIIGRTQTNGAADVEAVRAIQDGLAVAPLSSLGKPDARPTPATVNATWDMRTPPPEQVARMSPADFFGLFTALMRDNPPHDIDWNMLARMRPLGIEPGRAFQFDRLDAGVQRALELAMKAGHQRIVAMRAGDESLVNGWEVPLVAVGTYGDAYLQRAHIARIGLGANVPADAIYPVTKVDADGLPFDGSKAYVMHFAKGELPPVEAFWSLTLYEDMYLADNPIHRYAIGDRDRLEFRPDGSLDIYIQHQAPDGERAANWLPCPAGRFDLTLRLYWPRPEVLTGDWRPPAVMPAQKL